MARVEDVLGEATALGTAYAQVGSTVAAATTWNLIVHLVNRLTTTIKVRVYRADGSWASGEPTGGTLKAAWAYDVSLAPGAVVDLPGLIIKTGEKLVARADTASGLDIQAAGIKIT